MRNWNQRVIYSFSWYIQRTLPLWLKGEKPNSQTFYKTIYTVWSRLISSTHPSLHFALPTHESFIWNTLIRAHFQAWSRAELLTHTPLIIKLVWLVLLSIEYWLAIILNILGSSPKVHGLLTWEKWPITINFGNNLSRNTVSKQYRNLPLFLVLELGELEYQVFLIHPGLLTCEVHSPKNTLLSLTSHFHLPRTHSHSHSHSHLHLNIQTPNPHTIGGRKPVGVKRLSSAATSQLSHCHKRLKRRRCDLFLVSMMAGGVESWSPSPSPPEGRGEGKMVVVGGAMVMDFPLDDSGATAFLSSSSSLPFLRPNCLAGFARNCRSLSPPRRSSSPGLSLSFWCGSSFVKLLGT